MQKYSNTNSVRYKELTYLGFPGYRVDTRGFVWSKRQSKGRCWRKLKPNINRQGYYSVVLWTKDLERVHYRIHRLILEAFIGPCPPGLEGCHNNDIPSDNRLENIRWDTAKNNMKDRGNEGVAKLKPQQVIKIRKLYSTGKYSTHDLGRKFNVNPVTIFDVVRGRRWKDIGYLEGLDKIRRHRKLTPERINETINLCNKYTKREVAKKLGISVNMVYYILEKAKTKTDPTGPTIQ